MLESTQIFFCWEIWCSTWKKFGTFHPMEGSGTSKIPRSNLPSDQKMSILFICWRAMVCRPMEWFFNWFCSQFSSLMYFSKLSYFWPAIMGFGTSKSLDPNVRVGITTFRDVTSFDWFHGWHWVLGDCPCPKKVTLVFVGPRGDLTSVYGRYHAREMSCIANPRYPLVSSAAQSEVTYFKEEFFYGRLHVRGYMY